MTKRRIRPLTTPIPRIKYPENRKTVFTIINARLLRIIKSDFDGTINNKPSVN